MLAGAVLLTAGLLYWFLIARFSESTDDAYLQADSVTLAPKVTGYVREVLVNDNQWIGAGQPVVRLEDDQYQARLDQANATILSNQADIDRATAEITRQQAEIEEAQARQRSALVQLHYAVAGTRRRRITTPMLRR
jgi:membrane fusion protein (multidrug efflux system)